MSNATGCKVHRLVACVLLTVLGSFANAEELSYAIYSLPLFGGKPELVAEARASYSHSEIRVAPGPAPDIPNWTKSLALSNGFQIGTSVYREPRVEGFGMWIHKNDGGFSWEWFNRDGDDSFRKLQGPGQLRVRIKRDQGLEEITRIEFLTDVTMRLNARWFIPFLDGNTDQVLVKKGSVLWLAP